MIFRLILYLLFIAAAAAQAVTVTGTVVIERPGKARRDHSGAVVWLDRLPVTPGAGRKEPPESFTILQKNKRFEPHVLAVPAGSRVAFPNLDPFFHNVFSLFDGKRFDLGLYEAGASRATAFNRPGICFIFCNIHPEMSAVVVVLDTPYFQVTDASGRISLPGVLPGRYRLSVWHERAQPAGPGPFHRDLDITAEENSLGVLRLVDSGRLTIPHKNKYGRDYDPAPSGPAYK